MHPKRASQYTFIAIMLASLVVCSDILHSHRIPRSQASIPNNDLVLLTSLNSFLCAICYSQKLSNSVQVAEAFLAKLRLEAFGDCRNSVAARRVDELLNNVPNYAQRLWTSVSRLNWHNGKQMELCSLMNLAIRTDEPDLLQSLMVQPCR